MPRYYVQVPATMAIGMTIEADDEEAAKKAVFNVDFHLNLESDDPAAPEIIEMEVHDHIVQGNVFSGVLNEIEVEEADE